MSDFLTRYRVRARKPHLCPECRETIPAGARYVRIAGVSDGDFFAAIQCTPCDAFAERFLKSLDLAGYLNSDEKTYRFGSLIETAMEHAEGDWDGYRGLPLAQLRDLLPALLDRGDAAEREHQQQERARRRAAQERAAQERAAAASNPPEAEGMAA